nr:integrase, catalytic region, zinc finger, CCHC-type, peptidase aspartic, catalytic [Tanacetum cinerariifolium]
TDHTQARTSKLPQDSKKTNKRVSFSTRLIPTTSVSRPQLKSNLQGDRVLRSNSRGNKLEVEEHRRNVKLSKNKISVTACNDSLNAKTVNVKSVSAMCAKFVMIDKHDLCVPNSVAKPLKKTVTSESNKKPRNNVRKLHEHFGKIYKWSYIKCSKHMTGNLKLLINFVEKFLETVKFGNDQIAPILGYGDLVQGAVTIKRVYYVEGLNHNLFSVGQFCDADLEVAFRKSTCFIRDLKGNDLLTGSHGTDLPQLKSNPIEDRVMLNNSQGKKEDVEDHRRNVKFSKKTTPVTACNDSLNAKTLYVNFVCATCGKCVLNEKHDMCVLKSCKGVNSRTKMPIDVPVSTRETKRTVNQSVQKPLRKTVNLESNQKPRNTLRKLYERLVEIILFIVDSGCSKYMTGNLKLLTNFVEKFLGTVKFGNDQIVPILGYGDLVQGAVTIKRVYYVEGLNHNLFSIGQFCDADLEVAFQKSTCYIRNLKENDLFTGSRGTDLYSITLQDTSSTNPIWLMAKATSSQAWLWHRRLFRLNFDTINLLSKNDIVVGLPK